MYLAGQPEGECGSPGCPDKYIIKLFGQKERTEIRYKTLR